MITEFYQFICVFVCVCVYFREIKRQNYLYMSLKRFICFVFLAAQCRIMC